MEARGYVIDAPRTKYDELKLRFIDYFCLIAVVLLYTLVLVIKYAL
ncbi:MAG: energy-coupling factor transporter transmembrane protein EcfT [Clostridium sp.]|nr:MAG: energy-coupling factor transporter transmembrane protein EcfT [Clostridium sp.]